MDGRGYKKATDLMILPIQKFSASFTRIEALKIHKYLHPGFFYGLPLIHA
jgi:hypothetical protein